MLHCPEVPVPPSYPPPRSEFTSLEDQFLHTQPGGFCIPPSVLGEETGETQRQGGDLEAACKEAGWAEEA